MYAYNVHIMYKYTHIISVKSSEHSEYSDNNWIASDYGSSTHSSMHSGLHNSLHNSTHSDGTDIGYTCIITYVYNI